MFGLREFPKKIGLFLNSFLPIFSKMKKNIWGFSIIHYMVTTITYIQLYLTDSIYHEINILFVSTNNGFGSTQVIHEYSVVYHTKDFDLIDNHYDICRILHSF